MKTSIAYILAGLLATNQVASLLQVGNCRNGIKTRRNINTLSQAELDHYFNSVKMLNTGASGFWAKMTNLHVKYKDQIHYEKYGEGRDVFLVWHRAFLREMEAKLQELDPSLTIPYWDWSVKQSSEKHKALAKNRFGGPGVESNQQCIADGPFKDFRIYATISSADTNQCLSRASFKDIETVSDDVIASGFLTKKTIREFKRIEMLPHALPHDNVGGMMTTHGSPADPLFWSHHAFIDKLWFDYQKINPEIANEYGMAHTAPIRFGYDNVKVSDAINTESLCYTYPEEHFKWKNGPLDNSLRLAPSLTDPKVEPYFAPRGLNEEELEKFDRDYVFKGTLEKPNDTTDESEFHPIPKPVSAELIKIMDWDHTEFREEERKLALIQDAFNRARTGNSEPQT